MDGDAARPSAPGTVIPNAETWLDFADLVLVDPIGTGYSRIEYDTTAQNDATPRDGGGRRSSSHSDLQKHYWSINGDVDALASFIAQWLTKTGRHASPKVIVGESYGGFRGPKIARTLQQDHGVGVNLLVLVSPVLDYSFLRRQRHLPITVATLLPSLSAASLELRGKTPTAALMREAEEYARGEYLVDLLRGPRDTAAVTRVVKRVSALTGLPAATVAKYGGMLDSPGYRREINQEGHKVASAYDASIRGLDPEPSSPNSGYQDPFITALRAPLTSAMLNLYSQLNWRPDARYQLANSNVSGHWQYGNSPSSPEAVSDLKSVLALDTRLRVLVAHGYTDLVTPYFASTLVLDQLPAYGDARRIIQVTYPGGHMFYSRDASRAAFREDVLIMLAASLNGEAQTR
jgi:carboxypeptidase C (cathepsin A)